MSELPKISVKILPKQGVIDATASGEVAIAGLVAIFVILLIGLMIWVGRRPSTTNGLPQ